LVKHDNFQAGTQDGNREKYPPKLQAECLKMRRLWAV
jgi:hypothetical protein